MQHEDETRQVVEAYFSAWTSKRPEDAYKTLADDLKFAGPTASYSSAAEFRPALFGFAAMTKAARVIELVTQGATAALLYDCDLPDPVGTLRIASFFRVRDGRISWYETYFDATELRKILPSRT
jgi:ketosteroid isomerase-like protein